LEIKRDKFDTIKEILASYSFTVEEMKNGHGYDFISPNGGKLCIYNSGKVNIQGKSEAKEFIEGVWDEHCSFAEVTEDDKKQITLVYKVPKDNFDSFLNSIISEEENYNFESVKIDKPNPYIYYQLKLSDKFDYKITLTQYESSKLVVHGQNSDLWTNILEIISTNLDSVFSTSIANVAVQSKEEVDVLTVVTKDDQLHASRAIRDSLGACFNFLYTNDQERIEATEFLLQSELPVKDYSIYINGTLRAFEGFVKKLLIKLGVFTQGQVMSKNWNFGLLYNPDTRDISENLYNALSGDKSTKDKQETLIKEMLRRMSDDRNIYSHSGPPSGGRSIRTLEGAISVHNDLVALMRVAYNEFELG